MDVRTLAALAGSLVTMVGGCKKGEDRKPDGTWKVRVQSLVADGSLVTDCVSTGEVFDKTFSYQLFFDGDLAEVEINGESFASGNRSGCSLSYQSAVWLEERNGGFVRWQISGETTYEGEAGGCGLPDGLDWEGTETITVVETDLEQYPVNCTYELTTEGTWVSGG